MANFLANYCAQKNKWSELFGGKKYDHNNLSQKDVDELVDCLNSEFSPENLTCDGELSNSQVKARIKNLNGVVNELRAYAQKNRLTLNYIGG